MSLGPTTTRLRALALDVARITRRALHRLRDERGIALIMAIGIMMVLTIVLTTVIFLSSSSARQANNMNAGQKAYALAEAGVNNAISVLHASYDVPSPPTFPGDSTLLPARQTVYQGGSCTAPVNNCVTWSGSLVRTALGAQWPYQWQITSTAAVANPTGPVASPIQRTATAIVPVVIAKGEDGGPNGTLNYIYAYTDLTFLQSVNVATPVYATRDLTLGNTATITAAAKTVAVGRNLTLSNPQNQIGSPAARVPAVYVQGSCTYKNQPTHTPCQWDNDNVYAAGPGPANTGGTSIPSTLLNPIPSLSAIPFWYQFSSPGPDFPCVTSSGTVPVFDTNTTLDNSAGGGSPQNLTPNTSYSCTTASGSIAWNASTQKMTVTGTVYIDGSAYISAGSGTYTNTLGTIILSGTFYMSNNTQMCANATCDPTTWDPSTNALVIVADGDGAGCCGQSQVTAGDSIDIKKGAFEGGLIGNKNIDASVTGTTVVGPMISVGGAVSAGQGSGASFPPINFAPAGTGGITLPPPPGQLLDPRNYGDH
jgi:Tfp pilus assembly protein PilX